MKFLMNIIEFILKLFGIFIVFVLGLFILLVIGIAIISLDPMDGCMDVGYCKEELPLNIEGKKITVNKQTCLENDGKWLQGRKVCKFNWN